MTPARRHLLDTIITANGLYSSAGPGPTGDGFKYDLDRLLSYARDTILLTDYRQLGSHIPQFRKKCVELEVKWDKRVNTGQSSDFTTTMRGTLKAGEALVSQRAKQATTSANFIEDTSNFSEFGSCASTSGPYTPDSNNASRAPSKDGKLPP